MVNLFAKNGEKLDEFELSEVCPSEFTKRNPWSDYANHLFFNGGNTSGWKWKSANKEERDWQLGCFSSILRTLTLSHQEKIAVGGWMLSEMLTEVPNY
jgi:hypothetical protein